MRSPLTGASRDAQGRRELRGRKAGKVEPRSGWKAEEGQVIEQSELKKSLSELSSTAI